MLKIILGVVIATLIGVVAFAFVPKITKWCPFNCFISIHCISI